MKTDTVVKPRTVVVHVENALFASRTMMRSFRLEVVTDQTKFTLSTDVLRVQTVEDRYAARVRGHRSDIAPDRHDPKDRHQDQKDSVVILPNEELVYDQTEDHKYS